MDEQTIKLLNQVNKDFYTKIAPTFSETRKNPWNGWLKILPQINKSFSGYSSIKVLDVGCGNGRFATFLESAISPLKMEYIGLDSNQELLDLAQKKLAQNNLQSLQLTKVDILNELPDLKADLICLFGVMHHIPGREERKKILKKLADQLNPGGLLIFTAWQFDQLPSIFERRVEPSQIGLHPQALEENDYLLTWERGGHAVRYCHLIDNKEQAEITESLNLLELETFLEDGKNHLANRYVILKK